MTRAFRVGRILGIDIEVDWTWFIIFLIVALSLSRGLLADRLPGVSMAARVLLALGTALLFFGSLLLHELAHSVVARRNGVGITGITLFIFGGVSKMSDEPRSPGVELKIALAGPATSVLLAISFLLLAWVSRTLPGGGALATILSYLGWVNGLLAVFNLLPGFPLDGGRVLRAAIWGATLNLAQATRIASSIGQGLGMLMILGGILLFFTQDLFGGLWLALIGWFLVQAAQSSYQHLLLREALSNVPVSSIMTEHVYWVPGDTPLEEVMNSYVMGHSHPAFPVLDRDAVVGLLCLGDIRAVPRERWSSVTAREAVPGLSEEHVITPEASAWEALLRLSSGQCGRLLVLEGGALRGILSRTDIMRAMRIRLGLGT